LKRLRNWDLRTLEYYHKQHIDTVRIRTEAGFIFFFVGIQTKMNDLKSGAEVLGFGIKKVNHNFK